MKKPSLTFTISSSSRLETRYSRGGDPSLSPITTHPHISHINPSPVYIFPTSMHIPSLPASTNPPIHSFVVFPRPTHDSCLVPKQLAYTKQHHLNTLMGYIIRKWWSWWWWWWWWWCGGGGWLPCRLDQWWWWVMTTVHMYVLLPP